MLTCQFVAKFLSARGVDRVFGTPGSDTIDLINALHQEGVEYVLTHHENTACFMAAAYGELRGIPGVVLITKGPGVTNLASGMCSAHLDRRPIIVISAIIHPDLLAKNPHQEVPLVEMGKLLSKYSAELTAETAVEVLPTAYVTALAPRPGSVYIPMSPQEANKELSVGDDAAEAIIQSEPQQGQAAAPDMSEAADLVAKARRPIAIFGVGVVGARCSAEAVQAVETLNIPTCVTLQAVGQIPCDHPLYVGMYGWYGTPVDEMLRQADLILAIGLDGWDIIRPFRSEVPVVNLDSTDANDRTFQPVTVGMTGDLPGMLRRLAGLGRGDRDWGATEAQACVKIIREYELAISDGYSPDNGIAPQDIFSALRELLPRDTILTADAGAHKSLAAQAWRSYGPRSYLLSNGLSPMGFALGAAMGAKLAEPEHTVLTVVGDGGFLMYAGELATWARLELPMIQVVMVDNGLTQVRSRQVRRGFDVTATSFQSIDFSSVARSFGVDAARADTIDAFRTAVTQGHEANKPFMIEAIIDGGEYGRLPSAS